MLSVPSVSTVIDLPEGNLTIIGMVNDDCIWTGVGTCSAGEFGGEVGGEVGVDVSLVEIGAIDPSSGTDGGADGPSSSEILSARHTA